MFSLASLCKAFPQIHSSLFSADPANAGAAAAIPTSSLFAAQAQPESLQTVAADEADEMPALPLDLLKMLQQRIPRRGHQLTYSGHRHDTL